jgi:diguanylate cyclase (GGDEF)-like protein/PAS domain S-box-containing protein
MTCQVLNYETETALPNAGAPEISPVGTALLGPDGLMLEADAKARNWLTRLKPGAGYDGSVWLADALPEPARACVGLPAGKQRICHLALPEGSILTITAIGEPDGCVRMLMAEQATRGSSRAECGDRRFAVLADLCENGAVFTVDAEGRIDGWSGAAERYEGLSESEALGLRLGTLFARSHMHIDPLRLLSASVSAGKAQLSGLRLAPEGGLRWVRITVGCVRDGAGMVEGHVVRIDEPGHDIVREAELRRLADSDPLTGVLNRRAFDEAASGACAAARAHGQAFAVIAFDLDAFKALNDRHGHAAGDAALRLLVDAARADIRAGDLIGRLGGDEFAVALPRAGGDFAERIASRLRRTLAGMVRHAVGMPRFTASFGVAASADPGESFTATLARADEALYRAKQAGRDRVVLA